MKCKFCGKEIDTPHYFIYKHGSVCVKCKEAIRDELKCFRISKEGKQDAKGIDRFVSVGAVKS